MSLVECFQRIINPDFHLTTCQGQHQSIVVEERIPSTSNSVLTLMGGKNIACFGFFAEATNPAEPLALITHGSGLPDVRKMCDGIVIFSQGTREYILGIELKSGATNKAHKQIGNGKILCKWLTKLLREYGHWDGDYKFCGVLAKASRRIKSKGTTKHDDSYMEIERNGEKLTLTFHCELARLTHIAHKINQA